MRFGRVEVTGGFLLLLTWFFYLDRHALFLISAAACLIHELGHYAVIHCTGRTVKRLYITAYGAAMEVEPSLCYGQEALVALAGPGVNLLFAFFLARWTDLALFAGLNLMLGCFNLLPMGQLDGGRFLHCLTALLTDHELATRICTCISSVLSLLVLTAGILVFRETGNVTLLCVGLWQLSAVNPVKTLLLGLVMTLRNR